MVGFLWVNLHGSFILVFFLAIPALLFGRGQRKALFLALLATFALVPVLSRVGKRGPGREGDS